MPPSFGLLDSEMMSPNTWLVLVVVVALAVAIVIAAAEAALLRMTSARAASLSEAGDRRAHRLQLLVERLPRVLSTILLTALLAQIAAATAVSILAERWFGSLGVTLASIILTLVLFIYAEAIPKTFAVRHTDRVALAVAGLVAALEFVMRPVVTLLVWFADLQAPGRGITTSPTVTERELRILAGHAADEGAIDLGDRELIERAFRFGDRRTDDIMVPRTDIVAVGADTPIQAALEVALEAGHRRLPVYDADIDHISGVVRLRDLVAASRDRRELTVDHLSSDPLVCPETKRIVDLLREMQSTGVHIAVVVDEYGGTAGIVTVEDIAEELLGSISEGETEAGLLELGPDSWSASGLLPVEDLAAALEVELPRGNWNTVAGFVVGQLGHLPSVGDEIMVEDYFIRVQSIRRRRVHRVEVGASE